MADSTVVFKTDLDNEQLEKDLDKTVKKIEDLEKKINDKRSKKAPFEENANRLMVRLDEAKAKLNQMENAQKGAFSSDQIKYQKETVKSLQAEWNAAQGRLEAYNSKIEKSQNEMNDLIEKANELQDMLNQNAPFGSDSDQNAAQSLEESISRIQKIREAIGSIASGLLDGTLFLLKNALLSIVSAAKSAERSIVKMLKRVSAGVVDVIKHLNVFPGLLGKLSGTVKRFGSMLRRVFVFSVITSALRGIRSWIGLVVKSNSEAVTSIAALKGALLTLVQPILNVVIPAFITLVNVLTSAINAISQFVAVLFGTTAKKAQSNAKSLYQEASALESVGSAAEDAAGSLAGFDEINTIQTENSGGGGDASSIAPEFDADFVDTSFQSWGEAFNAFLDNILNNGIPRLKDAFSSFSEWLNGFSEKLYEMFTFPSVKEKVIQIGQDLANAFNELVHAIDWYQLGQALGAGLNLALLCLVNFVYTFDWMNLGSSLAQALNGMVSEIDWYAFGMLLWSGFKIGLETLAGFIIGLDMGLLAKAASDIAIGFFNSMSDTIKKIDWEEIGHQIKEFLVNVNWSGVAKSVFTAIGDAFGALAMLLWGLIQDAWNNIINWWNSAAYEDGVSVFEGLLKGILSVAIGIKNWLKSNVVDPLVNGFKDMFGIHSPSTVMADIGVNIMLGLLNGIVSKINAIKQTFSSLLEGIKSIFNGVIQFLNGSFMTGWKSAMDGVKNVFKGTWNSIIAHLENAINFIIRGLNFLIRQMNKISFDVPDWVPGIGGKSLGVNIPSISNVSIPRLATGAVVPPNREFLAMLGDNKTETEIVSPLSTMKQAFLEALQESGGASGGAIQVVLMLDGKELARNQVKHINNMTRAAGKPVILV